MIANKTRHSSNSTGKIQSPRRLAISRYSNLFVPQSTDSNAQTKCSNPTSIDKLNFQQIKQRQPPNTIHSSLDRRIYYVVRTTGQNSNIRMSKKLPNHLLGLQRGQSKLDGPLQHHQRPQTSKGMPSTLLQTATRLRHTRKKPKVNIMNLELAPGEDDSERRRQQELEQIEMFKVMIEKRKQQRYVERQKQRERFRQKCLQLLHRNTKVKLEEQQPNYRLIRQIISELKISRNVPNHEDHMRILALESSGKKQSQSLSSSPNKGSSELPTQELKIATSKPLLKSRKRIEKMVFSLSQMGSDKVYKKKIDSYLQFIYKINFANRIYVQLKLSQDINDYQNPQGQTKYKVFIGKGNNSLLIKSLIKRRFWLQIVDSKHQQGINFYWTQSKLKQVHALQQESLCQGLTEKIKRRQMVLRSKKLPEYKEQNLKIMSKGDNIMVQNYLANYSIRSSIYEKFKATIVTNHIPQNSLIGSKKALFHSLRHYYENIMNTDPFQYIPLTYHIKGPTDECFKQFLDANKSDKDKVWILKPGENSNRGTGICLVNCKDIYSKIQKKTHSNGQAKTYIIQSYINKPFLYHNRKFDIRHYMMVTSTNGLLKAYWYSEGYIRTSSYQFDIQDLSNTYVHLTNDAIQKYGENYGRYQPGNKLSYSEFQRYLDMNFMGKKYNFEQDILPKMKQMATDAIKANFHKLDVKRKLNNFEVFGLDFMIDNHFKPWLIEINFNPCLQISCPLLSRIIPGMIQNSLRIGLDPLFPPPTHYPPMKRHQLSDNILINLKFQIIFDQKTEGQQLKLLHKNVANKAPDRLEEISDHEEQYEDEGQQLLQLQQ